MAALSDLLAGYPFRDYGPRVVLILDEAQELKTTILETIRWLWDKGAHARQGLQHGPAFCCALVGNDTFMSKGGTQRIAGFQPLRSRVTHDVRLPRPSRAEHDALATALFPDRPELQAMLAGFGQDRGNLRAQEVAARQARLGAGPVQVGRGQLRRFPFEHDAGLRPSDPAIDFGGSATRFGGGGRIADRRGDLRPARSQSRQPERVSIGPRLSALRRGRSPAG